MRSSRSSDAYRIGELAFRSGLTADTLRYYERVGLLPRAGRTSGGFRVYPRETLDRLRFIKQAQTLGFTLQEIRQLAACRDQGGLKRCRQVRDLLRAKLAELQARLSELEEFRNTLSSCLEQCERTLGADRGRREDAECPVIETLRTKPE